MAGPFTQGQVQQQGSAQSDPFNPGYAGYQDPFSGQSASDPFGPLVTAGQESAAKPADPNTVPRAIDNPVSIIGNAFLDVIDMGRGLGTLGSAFAGRTLDVVHGNFPIQPEDVDTVQAIGSGILDFYNKTYVQPIVQGRPQDIATYALEHPLDFFLDANAVGKGLKLGTLAQKASVLPGVSHTVQAAQQLGLNAKGLFGGVMQVARNNEAIGPAVAKIDELAQTFALKNQILGNTEKLYAEAKAELDAALAAVPAAERPGLLAAAEATDPRIIEQGYAALSDPARHFVETARKYMSQSTAWELQQGRVTANQVFIDRYLPALEAMKSMFGYTDEDLLRLMEDPKQLEAAIRAVKERLNAVGVDPIYQGRLSSKQAKGVIAEPLKIPPFSLRVAGQGARAELDKIKGIQGVKNVGETPKAAWEYARTQLKRGAQYSTDSYEVTLARYTQAAQLFSAYDTLLKRIFAMADKPIEVTPELMEALDKGLAVKFYPRLLFKRVVRDMPGFNPQELQTLIDKTLPEELILPKALAGAFENIATQKPSYLGRLYNGFANFSRRYILGFNVLFPEWQAGQNIVMLALTQFTGPRDAFISFMSYALAADKRLAKAMPPELISDALAGEATMASLPRSIGEAKQMLQPVADKLKDIKAQGVVKGTAAAAGAIGQGVEKVVDFTFARTGAYDVATRMVAAGYYAIKLSEKYPELGGPIRGLISNGEAINRIEKVMGSLEHQRMVSKQVLTTLGDYGRLQSQKRALLRSTFLWWNWYEAIVKFGLSLPQTNPYKVAILKRAADMVPELIQDANLPEGLKKAGAVQVKGENDQGVPLFVLKGGLNPFTSISEIAEMIAQPFEGNESSTVLGGMNPIFPLISSQIFRMNPQTGREFSDPRLVHQDGKQYRPDDILAGRLIEQRPAPNVIEYTVRTLAPQPTRFAERLFAKATTGGEPSQFTSVLSGEAAPRILYNTGGEPLAAASVGEIFLEYVLGIRAMPIDTAATQRIESLKGNTLKKAMKSAARQIPAEVLNQAMPQ